MKMRYLSFFLAALCYIVAQAQRIQVVDNDGLPIPYVAVTDAKGALVGSTDNDGWFENKKGATDLYLSHLAFQAKNVHTDTLTAARIVMDDVEFGLAEVEVKPKELAYIQTYYRLIYFDDDGPLYFRGGVIDNTYDFAKKKTSSKKRSLAKGENGLLRFLISTIVGRYIDKLGQVSEESTHKRVLRHARKGDLTITGDSLARQTISDTISVLGFIDTDLAAGLRTTSFDVWAYHQHQEATKARAKGKKVKDDKTADRDESYYEVYRVDEQGRSRVDDFVMRQMQTCGRHDDGKQYMILLQAYTTARDYIDKKEFKQTRKDNEVEMKITDLRQFEQAHNIPALPPNVKAAVDKLFEKELNK